MIRVTRNWRSAFLATIRLWCPNIGSIQRPFCDNLILIASHIKSLQYRLHIETSESRDMLVPLIHCVDLSSLLYSCLALLTNSARFPQSCLHEIKERSLADLRMQLTWITMRFRAFTRKPFVPARPKEWDFLEMLEKVSRTKGHSHRHSLTAHHPVLHLRTLWQRALPRRASGIVRLASNRGNITHTNKLTPLPRRLWLICPKRPLGESSLALILLHPIEVWCAPEEGDVRADWRGQFYLVPCSGQTTCQGHLDHSQDPCTPNGLMWSLSSLISRRIIVWIPNAVVLDCFMSLRGATGSIDLQLSTKMPLSKI